MRGFRGGRGTSLRAVEARSMYQRRYGWFLALGFALPLVLGVGLYALTFVIPVVVPEPPYGD
jgi:hypothetical protein